MKTSRFSFIKFRNLLILTAVGSRLLKFINLLRFRRSKHI